MINLLSIQHLPYMASHIKQAILEYMASHIKLYIKKEIKQYYSHLKKKKNKTKPMKKVMEKGWQLTYRKLTDRVG